MESTYRRYGDIGVLAILGTRDLAATRVFWRDLAQHAREDRLSSILIRDDAEDVLRAHEILSVAEELPVFGLSRTLPIAVVDTDAETLGNNRLGELAVQNRGWPMIRVFRRESDAWTWLHSLDHKPQPDGLRENCEAREGA